jgi:hypothetical protein
MSRRVAAFFVLCPALLAASAAVGVARVVVGTAARALPRT